MGPGQGASEVLSGPALRDGRVPRPPRGRAELYDRVTPSGWTDVGRRREDSGKGGAEGGGRCPRPVTPGPPACGRWLSFDHARLGSGRRSKLRVQGWGTLSPPGPPEDHPPRSPSLHPAASLAGDTDASTVAMMGVLRNLGWAIGVSKHFWPSKFPKRHMLPHHQFSET